MCVEQRPVRPVPQGHVEKSEAAHVHALQDLAVTGAHVSHGRLVYQIEHAGLTAGHQVIGVRDQHRSAGSQIFIAIAENLKVKRRKPVGNCQLSGIELQHALRKIAGEIAVAIAADGVDISRRIRRRTAARLPDGARGAVRARVENGNLILNVLCAVGSHPAVVRGGIAVRSERNVDAAIGEKERRTLDVLGRIEGDGSGNAVISNSGHLHGDGDGRAENFRPAAAVERMQPVNERAVFEGGGHHVQGAGGGVDYGGAEDAVFRCDVGIDADVGSIGRSGHGRPEVRGPQRSAGRVRVEGINRVMHGRDKNNVVGTLAGNGDILPVKRLRVNLTVHGQREKFPECRRLNFRWCQNCFIEIGICPVIIVTSRGNVLLRQHAGGHNKGGGEGLG